METQEGQLLHPCSHGTSRSWNARRRPAIHVAKLRRLDLTRFLLRMMSLAPRLRGGGDWCRLNLRKYAKGQNHQVSLTCWNANASVSTAASKLGPGQVRSVHTRTFDRAGSTHRGKDPIANVPTRFNLGSAQEVRPGKSQEPAFRQDGSRQVPECLGGAATRGEPGCTEELRRLQARRIGQTWDKSPDDFNEAWYRVAVAKAIIFKSAERIVSAQTWYQGGYRANIVAYTIAKIAHDVADQARTVDFDSIWRRQSQGDALDEAIAIIAEQVHEVLIHPLSGISNVTEWAKKQACWERVRNLVVDWPDTFVEGLISAQEQRDTARTARREQRELNGMEAQIAVVTAGGNFWSHALAWGQARRLLTTPETNILTIAANIPRQTPTDKQSSRAIQILSKQTEGYTSTLPP